MRVDRIMESFNPKSLIDGMRHRTKLRRPLQVKDKIGILAPIEFHTSTNPKSKILNPKCELIDVSRGNGAVTP